jgi:hypothetical protein
MRVSWKCRQYLSFLSQKGRVFRGRSDSQLEAVCYLGLICESWLTDHAHVSPQARRSAEARFDLNELKQSCILINTADYCQTTALEVRQMTLENDRNEHSFS